MITEKADIEIVSTQSLTARVIMNQKIKKTEVLKEETFSALFKCEACIDLRNIEVKKLVIKINNGFTEYVMNVNKIFIICL